MKSRKTVAAALSRTASGTKSSALQIDWLLSTFNHFKFGLGVVDRHYRYVAVNRTLAKMNGLTVEAHPGRPLHKVLGALTEKVEQAFDHVFTTGQPLSNVQLSGKLPARRDPGRWLEYFFPLVDKRERVVQAGVFVIELKPSSAVRDSLDPLPSQSRGEGRGRAVLQPDSADMDQSKTASAPPTGVVLSRREREILGLLATGKSNKEISSALAISVKTVETYRSRVMLKTQAPSLIHLVHYAIRHNIVELQQ